MTDIIRIVPSTGPKSWVLALHCSLGSGRQWARLAAALDGQHQLFAPDLVRSSGQQPPADLPMTLADEVGWLGEAVAQRRGPIHLVGHSYGGAIAFRAATRSAFAHRIRSLTLIEPVLPTLLLDSEADRRLHDRFKELAEELYADLWNGQAMEAVERFVSFWNGSGPAEPLPAETRLRMIMDAEQLAFNFSAVLTEDDVAAAASGVRVPTLLMSGGLSPYVAQRTVARLSGLISGAHARHFPDAGHMLPKTHRDAVNAEIIRRIRRADQSAAAGPRPCERAGQDQPNLSDAI
jgi:pimeloyl-ACP methyl ester carboxylesterase